MWLSFMTETYIFVIRYSEGKTRQAHIIHSMLANSAPTFKYTHIPSVPFLFKYYYVGVYFRHLRSCEFT